MNTNQTLLLLVTAALILSGCGAVQIGIAAPGESGATVAATSTIPVPEKSGQKEQGALSKISPGLTQVPEPTAGADEIDEIRGNSSSPTSTPDAIDVSKSRTSPEPTSTPIPTNLEIIHTRFWPESDPLDRSSAFDFGASVTYTSSNKINTGVTAFGLKADEAIPNPDNCDDWTIPIGRPFWHDQETYLPGQHTFSRNYTYSDDPEYIHLVVWIRLWQEENKLYCEQHVYSLSGPTSTPIPPTPTNTPIPPAPTNTPIPPSPTNTPAPPEPTSTPIPEQIEVFHTYFWPEADIFDPDTTVDFGGSVTFAADHEINAGVTAVPLKAGEITQYPNLCDGWTIPEDDRPFWHNQETFSPGQHSFSQNFIYSIDDPEYTHLLVYVRLWQGMGETEYCEQHVYTLE